MIKPGSLLTLTLLPFLLSGTIAQTRAVITSGARLRKEPSPRAALLKPLPKGSEINVEDAFKDKNWTLVSADGKSGWVRREMIRIKMDDPWRNAVWLLIGTSPERNGFRVRFYLNTSQIVRFRDNIRFWTRMVPDNKEAYLKFIMKMKPRRKPVDFRFNTDLWEGDCSKDELSVLRSIFYWSQYEVTRPNVSRSDSSADSGSAGKVILEEACKSAERAF